ncbi:MAG: endonuclease/exonuclease/phosphatase family protein, partial [Gammaproteobacteria bacterium]|nr:endonuclease/exonuclease/phosphatase family protein [Gammaproteobacteria bacterium]
MSAAGASAVATQGLISSSTQRSDEWHERPQRGRLRLLSYNIQTGISTRRYREYLTHSWKHLLPHRTRWENLDNIADLVADYDLVGLQEVDAGSLRSGFVNQTEYLARRAGFPFWTSQTNRRIGKLAQHSIGVLSRFPLADVTEIKLPGRIPGRGVLMARLGGEAEPVIVLIAHLALGKRARLRQLGFLGRLVRNYKHVILMADLNCAAHSPEMTSL